MPNLRTYLFCADPTANNPVTGLTLTDFQVDVYAVNKSTHVSTQVATNEALLKEIGEGFYLHVYEDIDALTYDYFTTVVYNGAGAVDVKLWSAADEYPMVSKYASLLNLDVFASLNDNAVTGLALTDFEVDVLRVTKSDNQVDQLATAADMTMEVGDGHYAYYYEDCDFVTYEYLVLVQYEGVTVLNNTVWTGLPMGDVPTPSSCAPSYRRYLPRTLLPLDRWAQIIGIDPLHFRQVTYTDHAGRTCASVWLQYSWQQSDQISRYDVADAIQRAERTFAQYLGYKLLPTWEYQEKQQTPKTGNAELFNFSGIDNRGYRLNVKANWGQFVEAGIEAKTEIEDDVAITYTDEDDDGYFETATVSVTTTVTDEEEIAVFYPCENGADEWEIRPLRDVTISGVVATIKMWRHQLVQPDLIEASDPTAVDGSVDANFLTTVDVYRRYNDPSTQGVLIWHPNLNNCSCTTAGCCPVCSYTEQDACIMPKNYERSELMYKPATYSDGAWSSACLSCGRNPDIVELYYRAGLRDMSRQWPHLQMDPQWERMVAYYALSLLDRDLCGCDPVKSLAVRMKEDYARAGGLQGTNRILENPLGTTKAAWLAWNMLNEQDRAEGHAVRW